MFKVIILILCFFVVSTQRCSKESLDEYKYWIRIIDEEYRSRLLNRYKRQAEEAETKVEAVDGSETEKKEDETNENPEAPQEVSTEVTPEIPAANNTDPPIIEAELIKPNVTKDELKQDKEKMKMIPVESKLKPLFLFFLFH